MRSALLVAALVIVALVSTSAIAAAAPTPSGYRKATTVERKAMNKASGLHLKHRFAWFRGKKDPSFGFVCGRRNGGKVGVGLRFRHGHWAVRRNVPSGDMQNYDASCNA